MAQISTKILKVSAQFIISPWTHICNQSLSTGIFPSHLKYSIVNTLFKKVNKNNKSNYRLLSLLTSFSKILAKLIYTRIYQHLIDNHILVDKQYGFRTNSSSVKVAHKLLNAILKTLNNNNKKKYVVYSVTYIRLFIELITKYCLLYWYCMVLLVSSWI